MCRSVYARSAARGGGNLELAQQWFKGDSHSEGACPKESSLLKTKAGLLRQKSRNDRLGFTLAEVLITLGIIGVVAALTLPSLINKYRVKQLRTAFMRSSSIIESALNQTAVEFGYGSFKELNSICGTINKDKYPEQVALCKSSNQENFRAISEFFLSRFIIVKTYDRIEIFTKRKLKAKNYSGLYSGYYHQLYGFGDYASTTPNAGMYGLKDGSLISGMAFYYHEPSDGISITFDTNGPFRGPNRYGYDIFLYNTGTWNQLCTMKKDSQMYNGRACYKYALKDVNPDDSAKGYWDSLY